MKKIISSIIEAGLAVLFVATAISGLLFGLYILGAMFNLGKDSLEIPYASSLAVNTLKPYINYFVALFVYFCIYKIYKANEEIIISKVQAQSLFVRIIYFGVSVFVVLLPPIYLIGFIVFSSVQSVLYSPVTDWSVFGFILFGVIVSSPIILFFMMAGYAMDVALNNKINSSIDEKLEQLEGKDLGEKNLRE